MTLHLVAATPRSVALRLSVPGGLYHLPRPLDWHLTGPDLDRRGTTDRVVTPFHDLPPGTPLRIAVQGFAPMMLTTPPCAGAVTLRDPTRAQAMLDALPDGGTLIVPAGRWQVAPLLIPSHRHLYLAEGAELAAPDHRDGWPLLDPTQGGSWEGLPETCHRAILTALEARNITIAGPGRIDGGGSRGDWWSWPKDTHNGARRARLLHLVGCQGVTVLGPTVANSPSWTIHPYRSRDLTFAAMTVENPPDSPNTDGLNPESCQGVTIEGLRFSTGDDCIAIKAGKRRDDGNGDHLAPTRNITIRHCLMERGHGGVVIGSEMSGGVTDVHVSHCRMAQTDRGLRIKTRRGRGGEVARITLADCHMTDVDTVLAINAHYFCDHDGHDLQVQSRAHLPVTPLTPQIRDITVTRLHAEGVRLAVAACLGLPEAPVQGVTLRDVTASFAPAPPAPPLMADGIMPVSGAFILAEHCAIDAPPDLPHGPLTAKDFMPC
ncbi:glycoside hydrolase family 28 protein [Paracoccus indicus]|uniref:polygalacturonase PglA n=1 Tax=Paracoccus indicus TaxID=2079229 RepID=UPI0013B39A87|nr:glycoside hydrolase family 28 protein [Paracoccus indicus]